MFYIKMYEWILSAPLSPNEKIVLSYLRSIYEKDGKDLIITTSKKEMARFLKMSNRSVEFYLQNLKNKGYLVAYGGKGKTTFIFAKNEAEKQAEETERIIQELSVKWRKW